MAARNADFIGAILLHQNRRDNALGLAHVTTQQRGLLWYFNHLLIEQHQDYLKAAMAKGALNQIRNDVKRIRRQIRKAKTIEEKRGLLIEAIKLEEMAQQWPISNM